MSYFYLPKIYPPITIDNIQIKYGNQLTHDCYLDNLNTLKQDIKQYKGNEIVKKLLSPYNLLHKIIKDESISFNQLLFIEIFNLSKINIQSSMTSIHFSHIDNDIISALKLIRKNDEDKYYSSNQVVTSIMKKREKDISILNKQFYNHIKEKFKNTFDLITIMDCDYYDNKMNNIYILNVILGIYILKLESDIIFKIPNLYEQHNIELLYFVSNYFEKTVIIRPNINNYLQNYKYICCKRLSNTINKDFIKYICDSFYNFYTKNDKNLKLTSFLKNNVPTTFISKIEECNSITAQTLLDNYCYLHNICKFNEKNNCNDKISEINEKNKQKCINWCITNSIEYNEL